MVEEYKDRKASMELRRDRLVDEYVFINSIISVNTMLHEGKMNPSAIMQVEKEIGALTYETVAASYPIDYWRKQYGENMIVPVLCDVINYFLKQFQVKEMLSDVQIMQIATRLLAAQPLLRLRELVFVLNQALAGEYGPTYQRVGIDTILGWLNKYYESSAVYLETKMINGRKDESRGEVPWELMERKMKAYQDEQRQKKAQVEKVWGFAQRQRELEDFKEYHAEQIKNAKAPEL